MQEDKMDKWISSSLRKHQEENPLPYDLGAWEAFEKKRKLAKSKVIAYWMTGVAASFLVFLLAYQSVDFAGNDLDQPVPSGVASSEAIVEEKAIQENGPFEVDEPSELLADASKEEKKEISPRKAQPRIQDQNKSARSVESVDAEGLSFILSETTVTHAEIREKTEEEKSQAEIRSELPNSSLITSVNPTTTDSATQARVDLLKKQIADLTEEEKTVTEEPSGNWEMALGLNPGFGSGQVDNRNITGSSLGVGLQMALAVNDKLSLGSGMGVNYFSQSNVGPSVISFANAAYPVDETIEVQQVQVDIPVYVTYPVNRSRSITLQAGFSNLVAFNQSTKQESVYTRQVAVLDQAFAPNNAIAFTSESVSNLTVIDSPNSKFHPFATANLGVNFKILESKKTSYQVMPFYNYPIQDISGTGNNIGFFGAALKVNFGVIQKK